MNKKDVILNNGYSISEVHKNISVLEKYDKISEQIEKISGLKHINTLNQSIDVSLEERDIKPSELRWYIISRLFSEVDKEIQLEVLKTLDFLDAKMENLFPVLEEKFWISKNIF